MFGVTIDVFLCGGIAVTEGPWIGVFCWRGPKAGVLFHVHAVDAHRRGLVTGRPPPLEPPTRHFQEHPRIVSTSPSAIEALGPLRLTGHRQQAAGWILLLLQRPLRFQLDLVEGGGPHLLGHLEAALCLHLCAGGRA